MSIDPNTLYEVVTRLVGPIQPVGESHTDTDRLKNLDALTQCVESLITDLHEVASSRNRSEASMRMAGKKAHSFLHGELQIAD